MATQPKPPPKVNQQVTLDAVRAAATKLATINQAMRQASAELAAKRTPTPATTVAGAAGGAGPPG